MAEKSEANVSKGVAVIGNNIAAIQAALALARMGVEVKLIINSAALGLDNDSSLDQRYQWPLMLQVTSHPLITLYSSAEVEDIEGRKGDFKIRVLQYPRYINQELCTACGHCEAECSSRVTSLQGDQRITHGAIHAPLLNNKSVPSAYLIDKNGFAPCHAACPLGINVQGFVSLLSKGKTDQALALISESAPFSGILGRVCKHPCEDSCNRIKVDSPVFVQALHRYAADNAPGGIKYSRESPDKPRQGKIAIVGSGPAGLTAAWKLKRLGYSTTVFEAHGVVGGMLATGIPRFRLPREVREKEIEAIRALEVDIRTGITVGRDITYSYLKERGYRAFFLAIGAQQNNRLNIPGEEIDGVVDCMSLLLALNLKVDIFVGSNVAVFGGGNAAIDTARSTLRAGAKEVTIFYRRTRDEMPANAEEVEEALQEGIKIEYCVAPVEILGDGGKVTGIRCQRTRPTEQTTDNGSQLPELIPDTDFVKEADHVVVAIGQSPDASQLHIGDLAIDSDSGVIKVNPLTLETSIAGVFAGGDCIIGPNDVVQAMADGLRAAESIDRYLQKRDLEAGRSLETPAIAEIDLGKVEIAPYKREEMPVISSQKRLNSYEETTLGISADAAQRETRRCLNCALCSQCMECTTACELGAVFHDDTTRHFDIGAEAILSFTSGDPEQKAFTVRGEKSDTRAGIHTISPDGSAEPIGKIAKGIATALEIAIELQPNKVQEFQAQDIGKPATNSVQHTSQATEPPANSKRVGVFLCSCGDSISSVIDFKMVSRKLSDISGVTFVNEIAQACTETGAKRIAAQAAEHQIDRVVLAACRCCGLEQVCYSCTDRRQMCQQYLHQHLVLPNNTIVEFCNIREQCAWAHRDDPKNATRKAIQIISAGVTRVLITPPVAADEEPIQPGILIFGGGLVSTIAARALTRRGYQVEMVSKRSVKEELPKLETIIPPALAQFQEKDLTVKPWPDSLKLYGSPGNYEVVLEYGSKSEHIGTGALLLNIEEISKDDSTLLDTGNGGGLLSRIISRREKSISYPDFSRDLLREITIGEKTGLFVLSPDSAESPEDRVLLGLATAARVSAYLEQKNITPRAIAINIDVDRCRGCGDCANICPYIEMRQDRNGIACAHIDKKLCLGCGACITACPTGAISQPQQSDKQIVATLRSILQTGQALSEV